MRASTDSLTNSASEEYIPRTDEAEYYRAVEAAQANGLGEMNLADEETLEYQQTVSELGVFGRIDNEIGDRG